MEDIDELIRMANGGHLDAQKKLGIIFFKGKEVSKDYAQAVKYLRMASEQECHEADAVLGYIYEQGGYGIEQNYKKAYKYYDYAAYHNNVYAQYNLAKMYESGLIDGKKDYDKAISLYEEAAKVLPNAQLQLGLLYENCDEVMNLSKAIKYYKMAADNGDNKAIYKYAYMQQLQGNYYEAIKYYLIAVDDGNTDAMCNLGYIYYKGYVGESKIEEGKELLKESAKQKNAGAIFWLSIFDEDLDNKINGLKEASELGVSRASFLLGKHYLEVGDNKNALEFFTKAHSQGYDCEYYLELIQYKCGLNEDKNIIHLYLESIINEKNDKDIIRNVEGDLKDSLGKQWNLMENTTKQAVITGIYNYVDYILLGKSYYNRLDFSSIIMPIMKAFEIELGRIFLTGYYGYLTMHKEINANEITDTKHITIKRNDYQIFNPYIKETSFSLGALPYIIGVNESIKRNNDGSVFDKEISQNLREQAIILLEEGNLKIDEPMIQYIRSIIIDKNMPLDEEVRDIKIQLFVLASRVWYLSDILRNPSAHTAIMDEAQAALCLNVLIMRDNLIKKVMDKIDYDKLNKFVEAGRKAMKN